MVVLEVVVVVVIVVNCFVVDAAVGAVACSRARVLAAAASTDVPCGAGACVRVFLRGVQGGVPPQHADQTVRI